MYTLGLDTIAGAKLLQLKVGGASRFQPDQSVLHEDRRARFVRMHGGAAIIRHSGDGEAVAVPLEALSVPPVTSHDSAPRASAGAAFCHVGPGPIRVRRLSRAEVRWLPRHPFPRRPIPLP